MKKKMSPLTFYLAMLLYTVLALLMRVVSLAPLYSLVAWRSSPLRYIACLTPVVFLFIILPLRFSFADEIVQPSRERYFSMNKAFSFSQYGQKLVHSWLHALRVFLWGIPFLAVSGTLVKGYLDGKLLSIQTISKLSDIGSRWNGLYYGVLNFFRRLLGAKETVVPANGFMDGVYVVLTILGITLVFWLFGAVRNSAYRYLWVKAERENRDLRSVRRNQLVGRRWRQLGVALVNLLLYVPLAVCIYLLCKESFAVLYSELFSAEGITKIILSHTFPSVDIRKIAAGLCISFAACYLTLLPVRRYLTASFAVSERRHAKQ